MDQKFYTLIMKFLDRTYGDDEGEITTKETGKLRQAMGLPVKGQPVVPQTGFVESTNISGLENKKGTWSATDTQVTLFNDQNQPVYEIRLKGYGPNDI
jgi:hypothetical protein